MEILELVCLRSYPWKGFNCIILRKMKIFQIFLPAVSAARLFGKLDQAITQAADAGDVHLYQVAALDGSNVGGSRQDHITGEKGHDSRYETDKVFPTVIRVPGSTLSPHHAVYPAGNGGFLGVKVADNDRPQRAKSVKAFSVKSGAILENKIIGRNIIGTGETQNVPARFFRL